MATLSAGEGVPPVLPTATRMPSATRLLSFLAALLAAPALTTPVTAQDRVPLTSATKDSVITGVLAELDRAYVFPGKAAEMRQALSARHASGAYTSITLGAEFAIALTRDLQAVSHDKHLRVRFSSMGADATSRPDPLSRAAAAARARDEDFGIGKAEVLEGNVGYVEIRSFGFPPDVIASTVAAAMSKVADADALIVDVRENGGGSPDAVALVSSYLFGEEPVHLNSLYFRPADRTDHFYTRRSVAGKRFGATKPVYVLTSSRTFSAAEEFTYNLQSLARATIVGETTGGGAHPGGMARVTSAFSVFVPSGRAINPVTKTNWEGTGVRPHIHVPADSALSAALAAARRARRVS